MIFMLSNRCTAGFFLAVCLFLIILPVKSFALSGCSDGQNCYAYFWSAPARGTTATATNNNLYDGINNTGCSYDLTWTGNYSYYPNNYYFYCTVKTYKWDSVSSTWVMVNSDSSRRMKVELAYQINDYFTALGIPANTLPSVYMPNGPGADCNAPPSCLDSEKLCEQLRLVDSNNVIKFASYVTYENRNASMGSTSSLEYRADDFDDNLNYTAYMPIGINPDTDCFCPADDHLPQDLQNNFSVIPPGETVADAAANDPFFCAQQCFPKGYIYTDGKCICVDDGAKTQTASTPPASPISETPANTPTDPTDSAQQLGAVNENLGSIINQGNQSNEYLSNIAANLATSVNNQQGIVDGLGGLGDKLGNNISGLGDKLDSIQNQQAQGYNLEGSANLPTDNVYDSVVDDVVEDSLSDAISQYLASGIPVLSYINGSGATIANASSSMDVVIWGGTVTFDLSPMASILNTMGYFLTAISMIVGFFIIVGRG